MRHKKEKQSGQVLLVMILLSTILATIGISLVRTTIEDTRLSEVEQEAKQAFAAAEAGLEAVLETNDTDLSDLTFNGIKNLSAQIQEETTNEFTTPLLLKDGQFTFYLSRYDEASKALSKGVEDIFGNDQGETITFSLAEPDEATFCSSEDTKLALELTFVDYSGTSPVLYRHLIDECGIISPSTEWSFGSEIDLPSITTQGHLLFIRVIAPDSGFEGAKVRLTRVSGTWVSQGRVITSQAETTNGVYKKMRLFKSNPQIPSDFFVTSF